MFKVKIFWGSYVSTKIFYLEIFINETFSVKKFPNYGTNINHVTYFTWRRQDMIMIRWYSASIWSAENLHVLAINF